MINQRATKIIAERKPLQPWDRTDRESDRAWEGFKYYRDLGPARTTKAVVNDFGHKNLTTVQGWIASHAWRERAAAWDRHLDEIAQSAFEEEARTMGQRHAQIGMRLQTLGNTRVQGIMDDPIQQSALTARDAISLIDTGVKIERDARAVDEVNKRGGGGGGNIIFNLTIPRPPKWAPNGIRESVIIEGGKVEAEVDKLVESFELGDKHESS